MGWWNEGLSGIVIATVGLVVGYLEQGVAKEVARRLNSNNQPDYSQLKNLSNLFTTNRLPSWLFAILTALLSLVAWWQPVYRELPFYLFAASVGLIWFYLLIALLDWHTHLIFPVLLWLGLGFNGLILVGSGLGHWPVGAIRHNNANVSPVLAEWKGVPATEVDLTNPGFIQLWPVGWYDTFFGMLFYGLVFGLLYLLSRRLHPSEEEVFGKGDLLLALVVGSTLGVRRSLLALPLTILTGLVAGLVLWLRRGANKASLPKPNGQAQYLAYAPFLGVGVIGLLVWPEAVNLIGAFFF